MANRDDQATPWIVVERRNGTYWADGAAHAACGHPIPRAQGEREGVFFEWRWDGVSLRVRNDRFGMYPLFYFADHERCGVSTSIPLLLRKGGARELDYEALSVFFRMGSFLAQDTSFRGIQAVPPNSELVWTEGVATITTCELEVARTYAGTDPVGDYIDLFRQSMKRRSPEGFPGPRVVMLSGGQDSRHIALEIGQQRVRSDYHITVSTTGDPAHCDEVRIAKQLSNALDVDHVVISERAPLFDSVQRKNIASSYCSTQHAWAMPMVDYLSKNAACVFDGIGGDVLSAGLFLDQERVTLASEGRLTELADLILGPETTLKSVCARGMYERMSRDAARSRVVIELERHTNAANPVGSFYFWNRTRRDIALIPYAMMSCVPFVIAPYLDWDLFEFLSSLPASRLLSKGFHGQVIAKAYPEFGTLGYAKKPTGSRYDGRQCMEFARKLLSLGKPLLDSEGILNVRYFYVRLLRCLVDPNYARCTEWLLSLVLYCSQLGRACRGLE